MKQMQTTYRASTVAHVRRIMRVTRRLKMVQQRLSALENEVALDLIDGTTTGDPLLDFVLVACNGIYDDYIVNTQYRGLAEQIVNSPGKSIIAVQEAEYYLEDSLYIPRNIYLATLRSGELTFDIDTLRMSIPVTPHYLAWREMLCGDAMVSANVIVTEPWLHLGPLHNSTCGYRPVKELDGSVGFYVPQEATSNVYFFPVDPLELWEEHGIDGDALKQLRRAWLQLASPPTRTT